ncbi:hypothetical protein HZA33_01580 [Candidatus Pacearchaeota archaeon]|nr:hypothetical protein [Candidatus Pacearchaeota archaeon]
MKKRKKRKNRVRKYLYLAIFIILLLILVFFLTSPKKNDLNKTGDKVGKFFSGYIIYVNNSYEILDIRQDDSVLITKVRLNDNPNHTSTLYSSFDGKMIALLVIKLNSTSEAKINDSLRYIENNILDNKYKTELLNFKEDSGLLLLNLSISNKTYPVYLTKNGRYLFLNYFLDEPVKKSKVLELDYFKMSHCPFAREFDPVLGGSIANLSSYIDLTINFIGPFYSENAGHDDMTDFDLAIKTLCAQKYYKPKLMDYVICLNKGADLWENCSKSLNFDISLLEDCHKNEGIKLYNDNLVNSKIQAIAGSPYLLVNGKSYRLNKTKEELTKYLCLAIENPPEYCSFAHK